jgi:uncharacterized phage protein gp47/JayE
MPKFVPKRHPQILEQMIARVVSRTDLSDVGDSSVVKHALAAAARADDQQYYQMSLLLQLFSIDKATGEDLDARAKDIQPAVVTRYQALKATGLVTFSRNGTSGTVSIPSGTKVKTTDGKSFTTTSSTSITATSPEQISGHGVGRDATPVATTADVGGAAGNVASDTIVKFGSKPAGVDEVTNQNPFLGGQDQETDDAFRARIKRYIAGLSRCTVGAFESNLEGATDPSTGKVIKFVKVVEDLESRGNVTVYVDDGTGAAESTAGVTGEIVTAALAGPPAGSAVGGEVYLYLANKPLKATIAPVLVSSGVPGRGTLVLGVHYQVNYATGQLVFNPALAAGEIITAAYTHYTGLIQFAQKILDGDPNDRTTYPGLRAAGVLVSVKTPQILIQTLSMAVTTEDGYDQADVRTAVKDVVKAYVNALPISGDVVRNEIIRVVMEVPGVYNMTLASPASDIILLDDQLARTTDANITVS